MEKEEKKVEYVELIYDLIFVYIIGRNNSLLAEVTDGFISPQAYLTYILCTFIAIQIWNFTTLYINRYGKNGILDHVALFINMFLLYYMAEGTQAGWENYYFRYNVAWMLILINLALQYFIKYKQDEKEKPWELADLRMHGIKLLIIAGIVAVSLPVYAVTGIPVSPAAMVVGIILTSFSAKRGGALVPIDFPHLTERVMLYVVFTFGEMVIALSGYFKGEITASGIYFSIMAFLIVVGLFVSYEYIYNRVIDREQTTNGLGYMTIHIFLIVALSNITTALEFMREVEIDTEKKNIMMVVALLVYFFFLALTNIYARPEKRAGVSIYLRLIIISAAFAAGMFIFYDEPRINIAISAAYVFAVFVMQVFSRTKETIQA